MFLQVLIIAACTTGALSQGSATCNMMPDPNLDTTVWPDQVTGTVDFDQQGNTVDVSINLSGFYTVDDIFVHGFHIHESGDLSVGCASTDDDYNPRNDTHGLNTEIIRHVGDLGNIQEDDNGNVVTVITDDIITLTGEQSIIGRAAVVHASVDIGSAGDDHGLADVPLACCIITEVTEQRF